MISAATLRKRVLVLLAVTAGLVFCPAAGSADTTVRFDTTLGQFDVLLYEDNAVSETVRNFLGYVTDGDYDETIFHRRVEDFVLQGGGFSHDDTGAVAISTDAPIQLETQFSNTRGTIAMARTSALNSATSQFYFNLVDNTFLDGPTGYAVYGEVLGDGMDVIDLLSSQQSWPATSVHGAWGQLPMIDYPGGAIDQDSPIHDYLEWILSVNIVGDANDDGYVDQGDLAGILDNWGTFVTPGDMLAGDFSGDGFVAGDDLDAFIAAEILFSKGKYVKTCRAYENFLEKYPGSGFYDVAKFPPRWMICLSFIRLQR